VIEEFYGFKNSPFTRQMTEDALFLTGEYEETLARLQYAAKRQWFALLTGDCGTGKTTLIRRLSYSLGVKDYKVLYLADSQLTPRHFYNGLLDQLGVQGRFYRGDSKRLLHREVELMRGVHGLNPVVIVDEAHLLDKEMFEEIRFLLLCRTWDYAEWGAVEGLRRAPAMQDARHNLTRFQETPAVCLEDDSARVSCQAVL